MRNDDYDIKPISSFIDKVYKRLNIDKKINKVKVENVFMEIVGKDISKYIADIHFNNKILYLKIKSSVIAQEIRYSKQKLIGIINDRMRILNMVNDIKVSVI